LIASGETIGEMKIEPPAERELTPDEENMVNAVAQQVSLQIQNLRLLAAAERARAEAQAANRQFTHQNWESFMDGIRSSERIGYVYDQASVAPFADPSPAEADIQERVNVLDEHIGHVAARIRELRALQRQLMHLRAQCDEVQDAAQCGIMRGLTQSVDAGGATAIGHIRGVHASVRARRR
jgi:hypothetical protein